MFVGVARFVLQVPGSRSLKDRRRVVKAFKDRARARLPISIAEVGNAELLQVATLGVAVVSSSSARCREVLGQARTLAANVGDALLADSTFEVLSFGSSGKGLASGIERALEPDEGFADEPWNDDEDDDAR
jgi:uncharacterized protein YlxP (DUF503 family)